ncbi:TPA: helix-turn-helix transcriptional regulator [Enterobacter ludwigii]
MNNLKTIRESLGVTKKMLADSIGQTASSIGHYESGRRSPDIQTCYQLAVYLSSFGGQVRLEDIFPPSAEA